METCYSQRSHHWTIDWPGFAWGNTHVIMPMIKRAMMATPAAMKPLN